VLAVAGGTTQGERIIAEATEEARRILGGARLQADESAQRLREARETAAAGPPVLVLPVEPSPTGDTVADAVAVGEHIQACRDAIEAHRAALDDHQAAIDRQRLALDDQHDDLGDQERALVERRDGFVAEIDRIGDELPAVRDRVAAIDLPGAPAEVA
jgi:cell division septum initiation protein DivIVA